MAENEKQSVRPDNQKTHDKIDVLAGQDKSSKDPADISHIDKQEGTMNNGTIGGNIPEQENRRGKGND